MRLHIVAILSWALLSHAWMPVHKDLFGASNGTAPGNSTISPKNRGKISRRWLPATNKIRGVNLGAMFLSEPWMMGNEWNTMGCQGTISEFDCVAKLGQEAANAAFQGHWARWITQSDIQEMQSYGLNTIRVPVGYWMKEDLVDKNSEHFPQGGLQYLEKVVGWAADAGFYIIIDLHGAPAAQVPQNADTGQVGSFINFSLISPFCLMANGHQ